MSGFEEWILREYFEAHGFLVRRLVPSVESGRRKSPAEFIHLGISRLQSAPGSAQPVFLLFSNQLPQIQTARVFMRVGTEGSRNQRQPRTSGELLKFLEKQVIPVLVAAVEQPVLDADLQLPDSDVKRLLVMPGFPTQEPQRGQILQQLQERGVSGALSFRSILLDVLDKIEALPGENSEIRQTLLALKRHDVIKDSQLVLFEKP